MTFFERFMDQRNQKLNKFNQPSKEDSLPFSIEPLRTAPVTPPTKRVSNTSSDSGVIFPQLLSPPMPITPINSQPHIVSSASRINSPTGPLIPIQQFIDKSQKFEAMKPKYNRSQPEHPDPQ